MQYRPQINKQNHQHQHQQQYYFHLYIILTSDQKTNKFFYSISSPSVDVEDKPVVSLFLYINKIKTERHVYICILIYINATLLNLLSMKSVQINVKIK